MADAILSLRDVSKYFGNFAAVDDLTLELNPGEIFTLLGPSGCGKTTTLRMVAGLERPDLGEITCRSRMFVSVQQRHFVPPFKRNVGMVFQSYAVWPHMTVFENVAYPLKVRRVERKTTERKVQEVLDLVGLQGFESRPAPLLSGGQQQRVAIARALVYEPDLLLLDEPFSNLDAKLRERMRLEVRLLQRRLGITILFVTHDQIEALSLSDRMAVMNQGKCEQLGSPRELYENAATPFVRDFLGRTVVLQAKVLQSGADGQVAVELNGDGAGASTSKLIAHSHLYDMLQPTTAAWVTVRPEDVLVAPAVEGAANVVNVIGGVIDTLLFVGDKYESRIQLDSGQAALLYLPKTNEWTEGQKVALTFPRERISVWPA